MIRHTALPVLGAAALVAGCFSTPSAEDRAEMEAEREAYCQELREDIKDAKGKPLRRSTLEQRYDEECLGLPAQSPGNR